MKKILFMLLFTIPFMSFGQKYKRIKGNVLLSINRVNLNKLSLGMTKSKVLDIMGIETYKIKKSNFIINNPYKTEILSENNKTYEVLFYNTDNKSDGYKISNEELTPIVFYEGKVVGYGWLYVEDSIKRYGIDMK